MSDHKRLASELLELLGSVLVSHSRSPKVLHVTYGRSDERNNFQVNPRSKGFLPQEIVTRCRGGLVVAGEIVVDNFFDENGASKKLSR